MPYPKGFLESRAVIKTGIYTLIPPEGRVINSIPNFERTISSNRSDSFFKRNFSKLHWKSSRIIP